MINNYVNTQFKSKYSLSYFKKLIKIGYIANRNYWYELLKDSEDCCLLIKSISKVRLLGLLFAYLKFYLKDKNNDS